MIIAIIGLQLLMPAVFSAFEQALLTFFRVSGEILVWGSTSLHQMSAVIGPIFPR